MNSLRKQEIALPEGIPPCQRGSVKSEKMFKKSLF